MLLKLLFSTDALRPRGAYPRVQVAEAAVRDLLDEDDVCDSGMRGGEVDAPVLDPLAAFVTGFGRRLVGYLTADALLRYGMAAMMDPR